MRRLYNGFEAWGYPQQIVFARPTALRGKRPKEAVSLLRKNLKEKVSEALSSVLPITIIVFLLSFTLAPMPIGTLMLFILGAVLLILGMGFFTLGADVAMMPMGDEMGRKLSTTKSVVVTGLICLLIGITVTIAEPDLQVLARQVPAVPDMVIILTVAFGVGVFLVLSMVRIRLNIPLRRFLIVLYAIVFVLAIFVPADFWAVAFDSGGVTTGPITVPFIIALGTGLAALSGRDEDGFGVVAICSVGPIIAVEVLGLLYDTSGIEYIPFSIPYVRTSQDAGEVFLQNLPVYLEEVAIGLLPILVFFLVFQIASIRLKRRQLIKIGVGVVYTYIGLVLFLLGANVGFMPAGHYLGQTLAASMPGWILVLIGAVVGYFIVAAEPAVHVLVRQVEDVTGGAVSHKTIELALSFGVAASVGISMLRVWLQIPIMYFLVPGYAIALAGSFFVPKMFTAVAFDSGGVASGPMTATFLLPFAMGACQALGGNVLTDAFGVVAMVAMTPLITVQVVGLVYQRKLKRIDQNSQRETDGLVDDIVDYSLEGGSGGGR